MCYRIAYTERRNETKPVRTDNAREKVWPHWHPAFQEHFSQTLQLDTGDSAMSLCSHQKDVPVAHSDSLTWLPESFLYLPPLCCWASKFSHCLSLLQLAWHWSCIYSLPSALVTSCPASYLSLPLFSLSPIDKLDSLHVLFFSINPFLSFPILASSAFAEEISWCKSTLKTDFHPLLSYHLSTTGKSPLI